MPIAENRFITKVLMEKVGRGIGDCLCYGVYVQQTDEVWYDYPSGKEIHRLPGMIESMGQATFRDAPEFVNECDLKEWVPGGAGTVLMTKLQQSEYGLWQLDFIGKGEWRFEQ